MDARVEPGTRICSAENVPEFEQRHVTLIAGGAEKAMSTVRLLADPRFDGEPMVDKVMKHANLHLDFIRKNIPGLLVLSLAGREEDRSLFAALHRDLSEFVRQIDDSFEAARPLAPKQREPLVVAVSTAYESLVGSLESARAQFQPIISKPTVELVVDEPSRARRVLSALFQFRRGFEDRREPRTVIE